MFPTDQTLDLLLKSPIFSGVSRDTIQKMLRSGVRCERFAPDGLIFGASREQSCLGFICEGAARVEKTQAGGGRVFMSRLAPGDLFGAPTLFAAPSEFPTLIFADTNCEVLFWERETVRKLLHSAPVFAENLIIYLSSRILFLTRRIEGFTASGADEKLAVYLRDRLTEEGGLPVVHIPLSMTDLAAALDVGRASLYRAFEHLSQSGIITRSGRRITVENKEGLLALIDRQ